MVKMPKLLWAMILIAALLSGMTFGFQTWRQLVDFESLPSHSLQGFWPATVKNLVFDRTGQRLNMIYVNQWNTYDRLALEEVPGFLHQAFIAAEDQRFWQHQGADWWARLHAAWQNVQALKVVRGASTISEQVVRMLHPRPRTLWSRWLEGWDAGNLEAKYSKADLFEFYLNQVPFGAQRRGVLQASRYYFGRDLDTLNRKEMMTLAVLVRSPAGLHPQRHPQRLATALNALALRMQELFGLSEEESRVILDLPLSSASSIEMADVSHFIQYLESSSGSQTGIAGQGENRLNTSLDSQLQSKAQGILDSRLQALQSRNVNNGAVLVVDHASGEILSWVVGHAGTEDVENNKVNAVLTPRQPGSALKPFLYALALEKGWHAATVLHDVPLQTKVGAGIHEYHNYSRGFYGAITLREALGNSLNIPAVKTIEFVGATDFLEFLHDVGIRSLKRHPNAYGDGIALGNGEVSLLEMVEAYATLARMGNQQPLTAFEVTDVWKSGQNHVLSQDVASIIADILSDPGAREKEFGWHSILSFPQQTAVKTGTSSDYRDAWAFGYNDRYTVGVWMGNLDYRPMLEVTGASGPAAVLRSVFHELNKGRIAKPLYVDPSIQRLPVCVPQAMHQSDESCHSRLELFTAKQLEAKANLNLAAFNSADGFIRIRKPTNHLQLAQDPRIPDDLEYFEFALNDVPGVSQVDWYLNQEINASTTGTRMRWKLKPGQFETWARVWLDGQEEPFETEKVSFSVY